MSRQPDIVQLGDAAFQKMTKVSGEFLAITYGAVVQEMIAAIGPDGNVEEVNQQLVAMGQRIGSRLIEEYSVRSEAAGSSRCASFQEATNSIAHIGLKMFLGVNATVAVAQHDPNTFLVALHDNPLALFVEIPEGPLKEKLWYSNIICGVLKGALALVGYTADIRFTQDKLKGGEKDEIQIKYHRREPDPYTL